MGELISSLQHSSSLLGSWQHPSGSATCGIYVRYSHGLRIPDAVGLIIQKDGIARHDSRNMSQRPALGNLPIGRGSG